MCWSSGHSQKAMGFQNQVKQPWITVIGIVSAIAPRGQVAPLVRAQYVFNVVIKSIFSK